MKKILLPIVLICGLCVAGCAVSTGVTRTGSAKTVTLGAAVTAAPITADLAVSDRKVMARATGLRVDAALLGKEAVIKALGQDPPDVNGADVLVGLEVFTEQRDNMMTVTVTGYPAWYRNFRPADDASDPSTWLIVTDPGTLRDTNGE